MSGLRTIMSLSIVYVCLLAGCTSTMAQQIKPEDVSDFKPGVTTEQQVLARLGTPSSSSILQNGSTFLVYASTEARPLSALFLSNLNPTVGGNNAAPTATISFEFGPDGILRDSHTVSSGFAPQTPRQP
ncbi:outer membrane protein assembly factor BamE [Paraburkholderia fungorum]|jgi:outer membrane protein assembly factor BamE (lipoprotein component of BamABCDE complex)|uniref:Outer membrane protein assembly factor BamE n=1 Tax=Paraburkholderia fungorum TaxID=134537 RepID=A0AAP5USK0_9BURK|nr:outer membrane protein assembly factor BamE [Paraburkholderia fungorum]MDI7046722.1 outer membrane protein assembly factor BamE [Escherichia coli]AJZ62565.1 smpA / OmlA family protein [Paraburkholderia fungorum]MBB5540130.1 outer membrane protein assembly factor BamE (lipoprotein component of BamABCDE complex) [Paraburkholderia fungorum]MBU7441963.1 outer membrane protein assembly factor BamE [Paraburkholderia fungorum]MDT8837073.1 outer membrane protein assembly factor BamE [Paraburkholder